MYRPKQLEPKSPVKPQPELSPQANQIYSTTAKTLQNYLTNCIISKRNLEFYLKKTFENDQVMSEYNFYKEIDPIKLKIIIETLLKNVKSESRSPVRKQEHNSTELAEDYKNRLKSFLGEIFNLIGSVKATKKAEFNLFKYILKELLPQIKSEQVKSDIQFIIQENANLEGILDGVNKDAELFQQELQAATFADFHITTETTQKSPERGDTIMVQDEEEGFQQKTTAKKTNKNFDDVRTESKNELDPDRRELQDIIAKADSSTIQKFLNDLKSSRKNSAREAGSIRDAASINDLQATVSQLRRENEKLQDDLQNQTEDFMAKIREMQLDKDILQKEIEEKKASFELLKKKGFVEKENSNISLLETANKLLQTERDNLHNENENLLNHIKNLQQEQEESAQAFENDKNNFLAEKESLIKTLRAIEAEHEKSKKFYQTKMNEKDINLANTVKSYEMELEEHKKMWEEERNALTSEIEDRSNNGNDERQKILARLYDKEKECQELQEISQRKLMEMTKELQHTKETLLSELKESNKYKEKLNEILNENFQLDQRCSEALKEKKELECELQELSIRLKLSQETFQRELYTAENRNKVDHYEIVQRMTVLEEKYKLCKAKNENLIEENNQLHTLLVRSTASKSPRNVRTTVDSVISPSESRTPKTSELDKYVVKQEKPYKDGSVSPREDRRNTGNRTEESPLSSRMEQINYPPKSRTPSTQEFMDYEQATKIKGVSNDVEKNFGLSRELLTRTETKSKNDSSLIYDPLNKSADDYRSPLFRDNRKDNSKSFSVMSTKK